MDEEVLALLNSKIGEGDDIELVGDALDDDEWRSITVAGKSDTSSSSSCSDDSSSIFDDDSSDEYSKAHIHVGDAYQVFIPEKMPVAHVKDDPREGVLVWQPNDAISDEQLTDYIQYAREPHRFTIEQALGLLLWHKHDIKISKADLWNFEPSSETWSAGDTTLFEEAYTVHGKNFHSYNKFLPHKTMASLIDYYYSRYNHRKHAPGNLRSSHAEAFSTGSVKAIASSSLILANSAFGKANTSPSNNKLSNSIFAAKSKTTCLLLDPRIKVLPPLAYPINQKPPVTSTSAAIGKTKAPRGIYLRMEELTTLKASLKASPRSIYRPPDHLAGPKAELDAALTQLQQQRARCDDYKKQLAGGLKEFRQPMTDQAIGPADQAIGPTVDSSWTKQETSVALAAFRQYGANFTQIAHTVGTKNEAHVKCFYQTYRNRYNLDMLLAAHKAEHQDSFISVEEDSSKRENASIFIGNGVISDINRSPDNSLDNASQSQPLQHSERLLHGDK